MAIISSDPNLGSLKQGQTAALNRPYLMKDCDGYFLLRAKTKYYRWRVNLFNSAGFVSFKKGKSTAYGVILRAGRYQTKKGKQLQKYGYIVRYFEPPMPDNGRYRIYTLEEMQNMVQRWDDRTQTGIKTVKLASLKLKQQEDSYISPVPLDQIYLGQYRCAYNPSWIVATGAKVGKRPAKFEEFNATAAPSNFKPKINQSRKKRSLVPALSSISDCEGVGGLRVTCASHGASRPQGH
jgi:hypothetical protein